jgi:hypothetical protein
MTNINVAFILAAYIMCQPNELKTTKKQQKKNPCLICSRPGVFENSFVMSGYFSPLELKMLQPLIIITKHSIDNMFYYSSLLAWFPFAKGFVKKNGKISCGETFTQQCKTYCITFTSLHIHHKIDNSAMCVDNIYNVE